MNRETKLYRGIVLALAASALTGQAALAEDLLLDETTPTQSSIVVAGATTAVSETSTISNDDIQDAAVTEALAGVLADSKLELEMRLLGHKSLILTADL
jgi:hypothetical protein